MNKLLVSGACMRADGYELGDGKAYDRAKLLKLDLDTGEFTDVLSKSDGGPNYPDETPNLQFTAGHIAGDDLWLPTDTEIYRYALPTMTLTSVFSEPCFQNIHSVALIDDELVATSTGLDSVVCMDPETGKINRIFNAEGKPVWHRFDSDTDYRLLHSTRPHDAHPNFAFALDGQLWTTRCKQEDAVNLTDVNDRIQLTPDDDCISVHDGVLWRDHLVFTRVDGKLIFCDPAARKVSEVIDPFINERNRPFGWCRGLLIDGDRCFLGYSRLRKTRLKERLKYLSSGNLRFGSGNAALVVAYNLADGKVENIYEAPAPLLDAIYGVMPWRYDD